MTFTGSPIASCAGKPAMAMPFFRPTAAGMMASLMLLSGCRSEGTGPGPQSLLSLAIHLDSSAFRFGEPVAWRLELRNVSGDSLGIYPGMLGDGIGYWLTGPDGSLPQRRLFILVIGPAQFLQPSRSREILTYNQHFFAEPPLIEEGVFEALPPGRYVLRAALGGSVVWQGVERDVETVSEVAFQVEQSAAQSDSLISAGIILQNALSAFSAGTANAYSVATGLDTLVRLFDTALWLGPLIVRVRANLLCCAPAYDARVDSVLQSVVERYARRHSTRAFAASLIPALDSVRRQALCHELLDRRRRSRNSDLMCLPH